MYLTCWDNFEATFLIVCSHHFCFSLRSSLFAVWYNPPLPLTCKVTFVKSHSQWFTIGFLNSVLLILGLLHGLAWNKCGGCVKKQNLGKTIANGISFIFPFCSFPSPYSTLPLISQSFYDPSHRLFSFVTYSLKLGDWWLASIAFSFLFLCFQERRLKCNRKKIEIQRKWQALCIDVILQFFRNCKKLLYPEVNK